MKKTVATAALTATLLGGGALGAAMFAPTLAGAQDDDTAVDDGSTSDEAPETEPSDGDASETESSDAESPATEADGDRPKASERLTEVLGPLVDDGTITQAQADAVIEALLDAGAEHRHERRGRFADRPGIGGGDRLDGLAEATGIDADTLTEGLRDGQSLAEIAEANGSSADEVIDHLVGEASEHLDEAVAAGRIDATDAAEHLEEMTERITDAVNGDGTLFGRRGRLGDGFRGRFGPDAGTDSSSNDDEADA